MNIKPHPIVYTRLLLVSFVLLFSSCVIEISGGNGSTSSLIPISAPPVTVDYSLGGSPVLLIDFPLPSNTKTVTFENLTGQDVYLVKSNVFGEKAVGTQTGSASVMSSPSVRSVSSAALAVSASDPSPVSGQYEGVTRLDFLPAREFNNNPPIFQVPYLSGSNRSIAGAVSKPFLSSATGDVKLFWVQDQDESWIQISATLRAVGTHSYIWVADANYSVASIPSNDNFMTTEQADKMAVKFDLIYPLETNVFGYEYGGDPSLIIKGGVDGDVKISILIYDIGYDYASTQTGGVFGYFWSKDYYTQQQLTDFGYNIMTNQAEMFYLDANFTDKFPDEMYSTLVHEFQHMINFNQKNLEHRVGTNTWYNEMLSMVAEDMLASQIGIDPLASPSQGRIPTFNAFYSYYDDTLESGGTGVTNWIYDPNDAGKVLISYANVYAFGAYLVRNYGGAALVKAIMNNPSANITSVSAALISLYPETFPAGSNAFDTAFRKYGEALVYSALPLPAGVKSFNKSVTTDIGGTFYTFPAINIWNQPNEEAGYALPIGYKGPTIWTLSSQNTMSPYSVVLQSANEWQNVTGSISIQVNKPVDSDVELYLMVR